VEAHAASKLSVRLYEVRHVLLKWNSTRLALVLSGQILLLDWFACCFLDKQYCTQAPLLVFIACFRCRALLGTCIAGRWRQCKEISGLFLFSSLDIFLLVPRKWAHVQLSLFKTGPGFFKDCFVYDMGLVRWLLSKYIALRKEKQNLPKYYCRVGSPYINKYIFVRALFHPERSRSLHGKQRWLLWQEPMQQAIFTTANI